MRAEQGKKISIGLPAAFDTNLWAFCEEKDGLKVCYICQGDNPANVITTLTSLQIDCLHQHSHNCFDGKKKEENK